MMTLPNVRANKIEPPMEQSFNSIGGSTAIYKEISSQSIKTANLGKILSILGSLIGKYPSRTDFLLIAQAKSPRRQGVR